MPQARKIFPGDLIFFSGRGPLAWLIKVFSRSGAWTDYSHVGVVVEFMIHDPATGKFNRHMLLVEATTLDSEPCVITGATSGCRARPVQQRIDGYHGRVDHFPLTPCLGFDQGFVLPKVARKQLGRPYGRLGLLRCRGWRLIKLLPGSLAKLHCSESAADILKQTGLIECDDVSAQSPNSLAELVTVQGTHGPAWRCE